MDEARRHAPERPLRVTGTPQHGPARKAGLGEIGARRLGNKLLV
jgi:hypothetical protein